jgi:hypothetical protein
MRNSSLLNANYNSYMDVCVCTDTHIWCIFLWIYALSIWIPSTFWLLWIMQLWTHWSTNVCWSVCFHYLLFHCLGIKLLDHVVFLGFFFFFFLSDSQTVFHRSRTIFNAQRLLFLYLYHHSLHSIKNSPLGLEGWRSSWSGRVPASYQKKKIVLSEWEVEIFISQVLVISSIFSCAYWLFYTFLETCPFKFYAHFYLGYLSFCSFWVARL